MKIGKYTIILMFMLSVFYIALTITKQKELRNNTNTPSNTINKMKSLNNDIIFVWNDDEESIPKDGSLIRIEYTDENTVYIGPYNP